MLEWLQKEPDATAMALFEKLEMRHPGRFQEGQLRTLQRRVRQWRLVMARQLIYGYPDARRQLNLPLTTIGFSGFEPGSRVG